MTTEQSRFRVRDARSTDADVNFVVAAWDSVLPYLASIGAGEMWGKQPFSEKDGFTEDIRDLIQKSQAEPQSDARRILIAEYHAQESDGNTTVTRAGAVMIRDRLPTYLLNNEVLKDELEKADSLLWIEVLITDRRTPSTCRGAGAALVEAVESRAKNAGKKAVYVDAWAGNERKLNRYYVNLNYVPVSDFKLGRKDGTRWPGTLFRKDILLSATDS